MTNQLDVKQQGRRQFIGGVAATFAVGFSSNTMAAMVDAALTFDPNQLSSTPKLLSPPQLTLLGQVVDVIIPQTDTPGALAVNCHRFIDDQLFHCHDPSMQQNVLNLLTLIDASAQDRHQSRHKSRKKRGFSHLDDSQQIQLLSDIELAKNGFSAAHRSQFKQLKSLICFGYYTSKVGASQELKYQAIPGGYQGSVPLSEVGRSWGSIAYY
ncbi:MAG: hypothetical protein ACI8WB_005108 [Phenylobacterium sp.]|jgi:hypothetical protein